MQALVKYGRRDGDVELQDIPEPALTPDQVLLEVKAAALNRLSDGLDEASGRLSGFEAG